MGNFRGREIIAEGMEHTVLRPNSVNHAVLKVSRLFNRVSFWPRDPAKTLRLELEEAQRMVGNTQIQIPRTEIYGTGKKLSRTVGLGGFIIRQTHITEDNSMPDIEKHLVNQGLDSLAEEYRHEPRNFITNEGLIYWIDPTKGTVGRILERTKLMNLERYRRIRRRMSRIIRAVGL